MSTEENKAVSRKMLEEVHAGNYEFLKDHPGMVSFIPHVSAMLESVEFLDQDIKEQIAEGDWVTTRYLRNVVFKKDWNGAPAGARALIETLMIHEIKDGKIMTQFTQYGRIG